MIRLALITLCALATTTALAGAPAQYGYRVLEQRPLPRDSFVQGLEFDGATLLLGTGQYGQSRLRRYTFPAMNLLEERRLPARLFGEGITRFGDRIFQLTWRARFGVIYDATSLTPLARFGLPGEGWGLTHNEDSLIYSDGSATVHFLDPETLRPLRHLPVLRDGQPLPRLNELEWIDGQLWANVWTTDRIVIINPDSGAVEAEVDLTGLLPLPERRRDTDVLNGIAQDSAGQLWVTGKNWPWLYRIELAPPGTRARKLR
ncbi:glutaminyl-peptide cyclotransferase [Pseudohaliea rubra]|uniref:Glutamine cyclotransferase n=1 Tax=Pseudohaliea rubra DSM 19751 TaxID=1265313 RepID=A0A095XZC8_9GAMM|nr:glutaminyl-peptide cyclotransferase [Pseudohaliea rubra]KGE05096.1 Glutamine cyclotransferase [Pseudohaliea rubra DSM 19751]